MSSTGLNNAFGGASLALSLCFWFALLPKSVPGVQLISWGIGVHLALWAVAFCIAMIAVARGSRRWIIGMVLPVVNFAFLTFVVGMGEWMATHP